MKKNEPVQTAVYYPETEQGRRELAKRVGLLHADAVIRQLAGRDKEQMEETVKAIGRSFP